MDESACDLSSDLDTTCTGVFIAASITVHHDAQTESHVPLVISMIYLANVIISYITFSTCRTLVVETVTSLLLGADRISPHILFEQLLVYVHNVCSYLSTHPLRATFSLCTQCLFISLHTSSSSNF